MERSQLGKRSNPDHGNWQPSALTRRHFIFAGVAAASTLGYRSYATRNSAGAEETTSGPATSTTSTTTTSPPVLPTPAATVPSLTHDLGEGMVGAEVQALQSTLVSRQFDPGPVDGIFGGATLRAVWAFEKLVLGTPRDEIRGIVTKDIWEQMNSDFSVSPRRTPGGTHMEVYLPEQVSVLFKAGEARVISHVSSGAGVEWCDVVEIDLDDGTTEEKGICGISITPGGVYHFERKVDGWRNAKLGRLYQPVYFNYGIAIHGAGSVPASPAFARLCASPDAHRRIPARSHRDQRLHLRLRRGRGAGDLRSSAHDLRLSRSELGSADHDDHPADDHDNHNGSADDHVGASSNQRHDRAPRVARIGEHDCRVAHNAIWPGSFGGQARRTTWRTV